ncbi:hypothetical protein [Companilactobacillus insicii]|uniref:hypothetical protein n=1 Tax=Companilactobacillus insicii TaxID=1732567 RepID=UPI000F7B473B|nr:hypothetical protein [Companilactobacillus insicii]
MKNKNRQVLFALVVTFGLILTFFTAINTYAATGTSTETARINNVMIDNGNYKTKIDFKMTSDGSQLILYSPDYDNLDINYLKAELGNSNVVTNKNGDYVIVNLTNELNSKNSGSFNVEMKQFNDDNLAIRDMNGNNLAVRSLTPVDRANENDSDNIDVSNKPVLRLVDSGTSSSPIGTENSYYVTGNWYDYDSKNVALYYSLDVNDPSKASKVASYTQSESDGHNLVVHSFSENINLSGKSGNHTVYFWIKDSDGNWSSVSSSVINVAATNKVYSGFSPASALFASRALVPAAATAGNSVVKLILTNNGIDTPNTYTADNPYMSKSTGFQFKVYINTPNVDVYHATVYYETDVESQKVYISTGGGFNSTINVPAKINTSLYTDNKLHYVKVMLRQSKQLGSVISNDPNGQILASDTLYFRTGYSLAVDPPKSIDFGSYMPGGGKSPILNANLDGSKLLVIDGRNVDNYQKLQLITHNLKNSTGNQLGGNIYWGNTPYEYGSPIDIRNIDGPSSNNTIKTYDLSSLLEQNLKMKLDTNDLSSGTYDANSSIGNVWTWQFVSSL